MRIAAVTSTPLPPVEGIGNYVFNLARALRAAGHGVTLFTRAPWTRVQFDTLDGFPVLRIPFLPLYPLHVHLHGIAFQRIFQPLEPDFDLVHLHTPLPPVIHTRLPVVLTVHTPMLEDARHAEWLGWLGAAIKLQAPVSAALERRLFARAHVISAVAASVARELREYGVDPGQVRVIGNGVDLEVFTLRSDQGRPGQILFAGRLAHRKGLLDLVDALAYLVSTVPAAQLTLVGAGPLEAAIRRRLRARKLEGMVTFFGQVGHRERDVLVGQLHASAVYVQPSRYEGLSTSLLEAMACGVPVVATAVSGHLDVIQDGENGLLVPPGDPVALAEAIARVLTDPGLQRRLGASARQTIERSYTWQHVVGRVLDCYREASDLTVARAGRVTS